MRISYEKIGKISLRHSYYQDSIMRGYQVQIPQATEVMMQQFGIRSVVESDGISLYVNTATQIDLINEWTDAPPMLYFKIMNQDPEFLSITDLPIKRQRAEIILEGKQVFLFSNTNTIQQEGYQLLHPGTFVQASDQRTITPEQCTILNGIPAGESRSVQVVDRAGNIVLEELLERPENSLGGHTRHKLDLSYLVDYGTTYQLRSESDNLSNFLVMESPEQYHCLGLVQIALDQLKIGELLAAANAPGNNERPAPEMYHIQFDNREVFCRYNLIMPENKTFEFSLFGINPNETEVSWASILSNPSVLSNAEIEFELEEKKELPNGQMATPLRLKKKVKLSEKTDLVFVLEIKEPNFEAKNIVLPKANQATIKPIDPTSNDEEYLSDLYVYY